MSTNLQKGAFEHLRRELFRACAVEATIKRGAQTVATTSVVVTKTNYEDADVRDAKTFANSVDVLILGSVEYVPTVGDVVTVDAGSFVVRPFLNEIWKWDDPYNLVKRFHAQRRAE